MGLDLTAEHEYFAPPIMLRVTAERLLDQFELVDRHLWVDQVADREWPRTQNDAAMALATALVDALQPVR